MTLDEMARAIPEQAQRIADLEDLVQRLFEELDSRIDHVQYNVDDVERDVRYMDDRVYDLETEVNSHEH